MAGMPAILVSFFLLMSTFKNQDTFFLGRLLATNNALAIYRCKKWFNPHHNHNQEMLKGGHFSPNFFWGDSKKQIGEVLLAQPHIQQGKEKQFSQRCSKVVSKLSQSCPIVGSKLPQSCVKIASKLYLSWLKIASKLPQSCVEVGSKLSQRFLKVVSRCVQVGQKLLQSYLKVFSKLPQSWLEVFSKFSLCFKVYSRLSQSCANIFSKLSNRIIKQKKKGIKSFRKTATKIALEKTQ